MFILVLHSFAVQAQFSTDSLHQELWRAESDEDRYQALYELGKHFTLEERVVDSADHYYRQAIAVAQFADLQQELGNAYWRLSRIHFETQLPNTLLIPLVDSALQINKAIPDQENVMQLLTIKGLAYQQMGQHDTAMEFFNQCLVVAQEEHNAFQLVAIYNSMAGSFDESRDTTKMLMYYRKGLEIVDTMNWPLGKSVLMNNIADVYLTQKRYDEAEQYFQESIEIKRSIGNTTNLSVGLCQVAYLYMETERWERAFSSAQEGLQLAQQNDYVNGLTICFNSLADWAGRRELYTDQILYAHEGLAVLEAKGNALSELKEGFYESIYEAYQKQNRYDSAFHYLKLHQWISDTLQDIQQAKAMADQEVNFKLQEAAFNNKLLVEEQKQNELILQRRKNIIFVVIGLAVILLSWALWWSRKKAKLNRQLDQLVQEKTEALQESVHNLEVANEELTFFTYITSHDLREPLRNISGFASLLARKISDPPEAVKELLGNIKQSTKQMDSLIQDVMQYSLINTKELKPEKVSLKELVDAARGDLKLMLLSKNGHIIYKEELWLNTSKTALQLVINNLCKNAIHYNNSVAPTVEIFTEQTEKELLLHFKDNGIGIAPEFQEQVFMMFKRLHSRAHYEGSGLGLAITKRMLLQLGGTISLVSAEGAGSTFTVHLPLQMITDQSATMVQSA